MKLLCSFLIAAVLSGCATQQKELPEPLYERIAQAYVDVQNCSASGFMVPELAALGIAYTEGKLNAWQYDNARLYNAITYEKQRPSRVTKEICSNLAIEIYGEKRKIDLNNQYVDSNHKTNQELINMTRIKQTHCNQVGTQTLCTSY